MYRTGGGEGKLMNSRSTLVFRSLSLPSPPPTTPPHPTTTLFIFHKSQLLQGNLALKEKHWEWGRA